VSGAEPPEPAAQPKSESERPTLGSVVRRYVPIVNWLPVYERADLRFDALAGIVSWGVMVPVAMAYAGLAGMPPETGLVTAFVALAAYAIFGTSRHLKVTTSSSVAILSASVVGAILSSQDPDSYIVLSAALALTVGIILVVAGVARLGFLSQFLAVSVVTGFVIGLAVTITISQLPALLGLPPVTGTSFERLVGVVQEAVGLVDPTTAILGIGSLVGILILRRVAPRVPGALIALIVGIVLSTVLDLSAEGVETVGEITTGFPLPSIPNLPLGDLVFLITGAFGIVFLALAESIGAARAFGARHGYDIDPDQELIALGASNVASGLFGGFAVDASFSQSATGEAAGNRTQLSSLITAGLILATAVVLAPLFRNLPTTVLAAIVIASVIGLVNLSELRRYYQWKRTDFLLAMTALVGVVATTALTGMVIAVTLSLLAILYQASRPYIAVLGRIPGSPPVFADVDRHPRAAPIEGFLLLRPNVPLTFVNADVAKDQIVALVRAAPVDLRAVVLDIGATADLDVATTDMLAALFTELRDSGIELRLAQVRSPVRDRMRRTSLVDLIGEEHWFLSDSAAVAAPFVDREAETGAPPAPDATPDAS
jgi:high affinity sulfate transporter 1